jgi:hypothetical protein
MRCVGDETDCTLEAGEGIEESRAKTSGGGGCGVFVEDEEGVFVAVAAELIPVGFELGEGFGFAVGALGTVLVEELFVDVGGGVMGVDEFAGVDAKDLEVLVEIGFGELGLQKLGEVQGLDEGGGLGFGSTVPCAVEVGVGQIFGVVPD